MRASWCKPARACGSQYSSSIHIPLSGSAASGGSAVGQSPEEFRTYIRNEIDKWGRVIRESGATDLEYLVKDLVV